VGVFDTVIIPVLEASSWQLSAVGIINVTLDEVEIPGGAIKLLMVNYDALKEPLLNQGMQAAHDIQ
jgi:hypothetical protein